MITTCGLKVMGKKAEADWEAPLLKSQQRLAIMSTKARFHQPEVDAMLAPIKETRRPTQEEVDKVHCKVKEMLAEQCAMYEELLAKESWTGKGEIRLIRNKGGKPEVRSVPVSEPYMIRVQEKIPIAEFCVGFNSTMGKAVEDQ